MASITDKISQRFNSVFNQFETIEADIHQIRQGAGKQVPQVEQAVKTIEEHLGWLKAAYGVLQENEALMSSVYDKLADGATLTRPENVKYLRTVDADGLAQYLADINSEELRRALKKIDPARLELVRSMAERQIHRRLGDD